MKKAIHPKRYLNTKVTCACGNTFYTGSTLPQIQVEVCSNCHPFYTGQMKFVDTAGRVDSFMAKRQKAQKKVLSKTEKRRIKKNKRIEKELKKPDTLSELRKQVSKQNRD